MNPATDWVEQARGLLDLFTQAAAGPEGAAHGSDCRWCPVCQAAAVVRGERPEVTAALADVLTAAAAALRAVSEADRSQSRPPAAEPAGPADAPEEPPPAVQRIEIA
jgi:hypothetical protein